MYYQVSNLHFTSLYLSSQGNCVVLFWSSLPIATSMSIPWWPHGSWPPSHSSDDSKKRKAKCDAACSAVWTSRPCNNWASHRTSSNIIELFEHVGETWPNHANSLNPLDTDDIWWLLFMNVYDIPTKVEPYEVVDWVPMSSSMGYQLWESMRNRLPLTKK